MNQQKQVPEFLNSTSTAQTTKLGASRKVRGGGGTGTLLLILLFLFLSCFILALYLIKNLNQEGTDLSSNGFSASIGGKQNSKDLIGVVEIKGVILDSQKIIENLLVAEKNEKIKAIIIRVDSPGGAVGPTQEIYQEILRIDKVKPVYASLASVAASGGYYVSAATRRIYANPGTLTGSIGVIMQFMDLSKLYQFVKISPYVVKSGEFKDIGNPSRPLTAKEEALLQKVISGVHEQFISDILKRRKDKIIGNISTHAQGQIYSGTDALKIGLIDKEMGLWEAGRDIHKELKLKGEFQFQYIKTPKKGLGLGPLFDNIDEGATQIRHFFSLQKMPAYLYSPES